MLSIKTIKTIPVLLVTILIFPSFAQKSRETPVPQPADTAICKSIVHNYCQLWKNQQYDTMYAILNVNGLGSIPKEQFLFTYKADPDNSGKIKGFTVKQAALAQDAIIVKAELSFIKEKTPLLINGVYNFHMSKDKGAWKIKTIVAPLKMPGGEDKGGGHPGE